MEPQSTSSVRRVRTYADDLRRAQGVQQPTAAPVVAHAASSIAPTITERSEETPIAGVSLPTGPAVPTPSAPLDDSLNIRVNSVGADDASIITDRRTHQWSFSSAVSEAFRTWWKDTFSSLEKEKKMPRVAPAAKRTVIIKAASAQGQIAPQNEHQAAVAAIKARAGSAIDASTSFKAVEPTAADEVAPSWTHTIGAPEPKAPEPAPVNTDLSRKRPRGVVMPIRPAEQKIAPQKKFIEYEPPKILKDSQAEARTDVPDIDNAAPEELMGMSKDFAELARVRAREIASARASASARSASPVLVYLGIAVAGMFVLVLVGGIVYSILSRSNTNVPAPTAGTNIVPLLFPVERSEAVVIPNDRSALLADLTDRTTNASGSSGAFVNFYLTYPSDPSERALPAQAFIDALGLRAPSSFLRTIDPLMMLGAHISNPNAPFIVFRVHNSAEALGGMLQWEKTVNADLAPLFGENLAFRGEDPSAFRDEIINGNDARALYDSTGTLILVYSFVDRNTIVITTARTTLITLMSALRVP